MDRSSGGVNKVLSRQRSRSNHLVQLRGAADATAADAATVDVGREAAAADKKQTNTNPEQLAGPEP